MGQRTHLIPKIKTDGVGKWLTPDSLSGFLGELSWDRRGRGIVLGVILLAVWL